jgi:hypothetical protein
VEASIALGLFLVFMLAIYEYARFMFIQQLVENATREGCRQAVVGTNRLSTDDVRAVVKDWLLQQLDEGTEIRDQDIEVVPAAGSTGATWTDVPYGQSIMVRTTVNYEPMFPTGFDMTVGESKYSFRYLPDPVRITATAIMQSEAN